MKLHAVFAAAVASVVMAGAPALAGPVRPGLPSMIALAVADPNRPADQRALDAERKPVEVLQFADLRRGYKVIVLRRHGRDVPMPFGPFIAAAGWVWFVAGGSLLHWYFAMFTPIGR